MLQINKLVCPSDLEEAYMVFSGDSKSVILGGCGYLRLAKRTIDTAIDLTGLDLDFIKKSDGRIEIGAMTTLRQIETSPETRTPENCMLADSIKNIVGVQLRNSVTIGGTVAGRYPFSDPITALVALDTRVELYHHGEMALVDYLASKGLRDIVVKIIVPDDDRAGAFASIRKSATDYAALNCAVSRRGGEYRIVVGSRPGKAARALEAEQFLEKNGADSESMKRAGELAAEALTFGDNPRGSGSYRKAICPVLIGRALAEVCSEA